MITTACVLLLGGLLAFVNGANDAAKGIATLVGSGVSNYRRALVWGAAWTAIGGLLGTLFGNALVSTFGKGILASETTFSFTATSAVIVGAVGWLFFATRNGLPVSTTHAMVGSLVAVATLAYGGGGVQWYALASKLVLPLLLSPIAALILTGLLLRSLQQYVRPSNSCTDCLCVEVAPALAIAHGPSNTTAAAVAPDAVHLQITRGETAVCRAIHPTAARLTLNNLHWLASGVTSLARAMNDAPKLVALVTLSAASTGRTSLATPFLFAFVTTAMILGSLIAGYRVTHTLADKVTPMGKHEGCYTNLVIAGLVATGAVLGLPMSTTHVSAGAIFGAGVARKALNTIMLENIVLGWFVTLPSAALFGATSYLVITALM